MTQIFILTAQSVTGAVFTIIGLLLVAGIIGYITAWLYAKSVYVPVITGLNKDKEELTSQVENLNRQVEALKGENKNLNKTNANLEETIKVLKKDIEEKEAAIKNLKMPER